MRHFLDCLMLGVLLTALAFEVGIVVFAGLAIAGFVKRKGAG